MQKTRVTLDLKSVVVQLMRLRFGFLQTDDIRILFFQPGKYTFPGTWLQARLLRSSRLMH